jgi:hypothetical protein
VSNPYVIDGPAMISFSGGRTSALMLRRILDQGVQADVHVLFANTGKEREETLDFVHRCAVEWGVGITWLERRPSNTWIEVTYETASRQGEPFTQLIQERQFLPNPVTRFCTQELKIRVMKKWMLAHGYEHWTNVVGFRADEAHRVARARAGQGKERWDFAFPLYDDGVTSSDVLSLWTGGAFGFDLRLDPWEGNCDLCMLKGQAKRRRIMRDRPDLATWWIEAEAEAKTSSPDGAFFRKDTPSYARLLQISSQPMLPFSDADLDGRAMDDLGDCTCTD